MSESCLFCRIVTGEIPATIIRDDARTLAFRDLAPQAPVHVLVIPKSHYRDAAAVLEADPLLLAELYSAAVAVAGQEGLADGYRMVINTGPDGGQTVGHAHVHLIGGRAMTWPPG